MNIIITILLKLDFANYQVESNPSVLRRKKENEKKNLDACCVHVRIMTLSRG